MFLTVLYIPISIIAPLCGTLVLIKSIEKIENIHKHCLRLTLNDSKSDYKTLLDKTKTLAIEIFKTANELNHNFNKTIFTSKTKSRV